MPQVPQAKVQPQFQGKIWNAYKDSFKKRPAVTAGSTMAAVLVAPLGIVPIVGGSLLSLSGIVLTGAAAGGSKVAVDKAKDMGLIDEDKK